MKCPIDKEEMEKGTLVNNGLNWNGNSNSLLVNLRRGLVGNLSVFAYRCPKCGKIELATEK